MGGEPVGASLALIAVMLGAWFGAIGIGTYVVWASMRGVTAPSVQESSEPTQGFREEVA